MSMRFVVTCPASRSGGQEALHQLVDSLDELGIEAGLLYARDVNDQLVPEPGATGLYRDSYSDRTLHTDRSVLEAFEPDTILVLPEIWLHHSLKLARRHRVLIWWLSVDNGLLALGRTRFRLDELRTHPNIVHAYQSGYAAAFLNSLGLNQHGLSLSDYTRAHQAASGENDSANCMAPGSGAPLRVSFYPEKGAWLAKAFSELHPEVTLIPIRGMTAREVWTTLSTCTAYIDFGHLPGKDRLPREALRAGARVFLRGCGAGGHHDDWSLPQSAYFTTEDCFTGELAKRLASSEQSDDGVSAWHEAQQKVDTEAQVFRSECEELINLMARLESLPAPQRQIAGRLNGIRGFDDELRVARQRCDELEQQIQRIHSSRSWTITTPMRRVLGSLKDWRQGFRR